MARHQAAGRRSRRRLRRLAVTRPGSRAMRADVELHTRLAARAASAAMGYTTSMSVLRAELDASWLLCSAARREGAGLGPTTLPAMIERGP